MPVALIMRGRPDIAPRWLTLAQARAYSGLGRDTLRRLADEGQIRCGRTPGGHRRWDRESIDEYFGQDREILAIAESLGL